MLYIGVDIGSTASKVAILNEELAIRELKQVDISASNSAVYEIIKILKLQEKTEYKIFSTGYGRNLIENRCGESSEIICHARGVHFFNKQARTVIDVGGQDIKVIDLNEFGKVQNFMMNDKCSAGTGRFFEVMAKILGVEVSNLSELAEKSRKRITISNICTVFAESEVISYLSKGVHAEDIARGVNESVAKRVNSLLTRSSMKNEMVLTGGVSENSNLVDQLSEISGRTIKVSQYARFTGAIGAAIIAFERS